MAHEAPISPILFWSRKIRDANLYQTARRVISSATGTMPATVSDDFELGAFFADNPDATLYYPVFAESRGWWGELLGQEAKVTGKLIVSPECQIMVIVNGQRPAANGRERQNANGLYAVEIFPTSAFFKKMNSGIATVCDMLATDSGTILALFSGKNQKKFQSTIESTGNMYLGSIGGY